MTIDKKTVNYICINFINLMLFIVLFISNKLPYKYLIYTCMVVIYLTYLFTMKSTEVIKYQISFMLISSACLDMLYLNSGKSIPIEIKYIVDIVLLLLCFKILINTKKYKEVLRDIFIVIIIMCILFNIITCIVNNGDFYDLINGIRLYYRFIPVYIILSLNDFEFNKEYRWYYIINIIACAFQVLINMHQDNINGLFGATGSPACSLFMTIALVGSLLKYINKKIQLYKLLIMLFITLFYFVFSENKAFIFISCVNILVIILLSNGAKYKKIFITISSILVLFVGIQAINKIFPVFGDMFRLSTMRTTIESYLFKNNNNAFSLGRIDAIKYISDIELNTASDKLIGNGLGTGLPQENWYYSNYKSIEGRYVVDNKPSTLLNSYGYDLGYHLTVGGILYLETGYIGIIVFFAMYIIFTKRSLYIIRNTKDNEKYLIGIVGIVTIISSLFPFIYGGGLINRNLMFIVFIILGRISYVYRCVKQKVIHN